MTMRSLASNALHLMDWLHDISLPIGGAWWSLRWRLVRYLGRAGRAGR